MPLFGNSRHKEKEQLEAFAKLHGLQYSEADAFGLVELPFPVFSEGDDQGCQDVVYGTWNGENAWAFTLWTRDTDSDGNHAYSNYTCAAAPLPADCPSIDIHAVGGLTRAMRSIGLGGQQVPFESEEFNKRFRVTSAEPKFAIEVIPPDMIEWLLANAEDWHFEVNRNYILVYRWRERHDVDLVAHVLDLVTGFYGHIPDVVASLHRLNLQPQLTPQQIYEMARAKAVGFDPVAPGTAGAGVGEATTLGAAAAGNPAVAVALQQLQGMGFAVGPGTPVEVVTSTQAQVVGPQIPGAGAAAGAAVAGHMTITGIQELGTSIGEGRMVQLDADVTPEGGQPYHMTQTALVMPQHAYRVKQGAVLSVKIDPSNPSMLSVDWDAS